MPLPCTFSRHPTEPFEPAWLLRYDRGVPLPQAAVQFRNFRAPVFGSYVASAGAGPLQLWHWLKRCPGGALQRQLTGTVRVSWENVRTRRGYDACLIQAAT